MNLNNPLPWFNTANRIQVDSESECRYLRTDPFRPVILVSFCDGSDPMKQLSRRQFLRTSGLGVAAFGAMQAPVFGQARRRVIVIGGGWGGATAAKYVRLGDPSIDVIMLEPNKQFISCPFSNLVLSGVRTLDSMTFDYGRLRGHGVRVIHEMATAIEPAAKRVRVGEGWLEYDKVIVSPGVEFQYEQIEGCARPATASCTRGRRGRRRWRSPSSSSRWRRRRGGHDGATGRLPLPAGALRAGVADRVVHQDQEAEVEADRARRQSQRRLEDGAVPQGVGGVPEPRVPRLNKVVKVDRRAAPSAPSSATP